MQIAYLGPAGTYSEEAARRYDAQASLFSCASFDDIITAVEQGKADVGVLPIENSTEGSVVRTLDLLLETELSVAAELFLPIHHQLLSKAADLQAVREVYAHPQALGQCRKWLDAHLPQASRIAASSNAEAARLVTDTNDKAAIAGTAAAALYSLPTLAANIEDERTNTTRFIVLGDKQLGPTGNDKTSLVFSTQNVAGALYNILGILTQHNISMNKIESRPIAAKPWEYVFYTDIDGHQQDKAVAAALAEVARATTFLKILGSYPKAS